ncbi:DUF1294 domain-containing protein [Halalkalibacter urbisdiaboli]|uniref:DUF1294 domain-containing protein n=1 Tax=Halalkalibacter urbisdiaboli TaxID=1960589 RepID=UPI000B43D734|nr:DUF1294 domain-containing protein [Halalkalibacter urbisdiaboli]
MGVLIIYIMFVSICGLVLMSYDKRQAIKKKRRVRERTLFLIALIGGSGGVYLGMNLFRHKTKHRSFSLGLPVMILLQVAIIIYFLVQFVI